MEKLKLKSLKGIEINSVSDREAMGLSAHYQELLAEQTNDNFNQVRRLSGLACAALAENTEACFADRLAAGRNLALLGDHRIKPFLPTMISIAKATVKIGLEAQMIGNVCGLYSETGCKKEWILKECPEFQADVATFRIAKYPVTNLEYLCFLKDYPFQEVPSSWIFGRYPSEHANHPVYSIKPETADCFAAWLSDKTGRRFKLPSEIEWEYAAKGNTQNEFPWGNHFGHDLANSVELGFLASTPVGIFPCGASPFGCLDMAGNVEEYTSSIYTPYGQEESVQDDLALRNPTYRIARGGSFARLRDLLRTKRRHGQFPRDIYAMGFRLAEDV